MKLIKKLIFLLIVIIIIIGTVFILNGKKMYDDAIAKTSLTETVKKIQNDKNYIKLEDLPKLHQCNYRC